jgi:DNA-binding NarL/FixJ family response regulator
LARQIRILIIEDNRLLRDGINAVLAQQPDLEVVDALLTGENVPAKVRSSNVDVVLLDLGLRSHSSLEVVRQIVRDAADARVIMMGLFPSRSEVLDFVRAGAIGFLMKDATVEDFVGTIRSVAEGASVLPAQLTESLFSQIIDQAAGDPEGEKKINGAIRMTNREQQVVAGIANGLTNKEIARDLSISSHTVKSHVHNILEKLTLRSRLQIARYAHRTDAHRPKDR